MTDPIPEPTAVEPEAPISPVDGETIELDAQLTPVPDSGANPEPTTSCPQCQAARTIDATYCLDCGYIFANEMVTYFEQTTPTELIGGRYQLEALASERDGVSRYRGWDLGAGISCPVILLREMAHRKPIPQATTPELSLDEHTDFNLPDDVEQRTEELLDVVHDAVRWPSIAWETRVLQGARHLSLPRVLDTVHQNGANYLIIEVPTGQSLWDAWDRPNVTWRERFGWLVQIAEAIQCLHQSGVILEELRPEMIVVNTTGQAIFQDLSCLLPLPLSPEVPLRGRLSSAPELLLRPALTNEQADIYVFGALLYALMMGRELTDLDFSLAGKPRSFLERFPDAHPMLARLMAKTFVRELHQRFPTEDAADVDPSGFTELIDYLQACRRTLDRVHLEISAWSNTGITRTGNEDAVAIVHSTEGRLSETDEFALVLLADGMGGMESGEMAAAMTMQVLRQRLMNTPPFAAFQTRSVAAQMGSEKADPTPVLNEPKTPKTMFMTAAKFNAEGLMVNPEDRDTAARSVEAYRERIVEALKEANRQVHDAARYGFGGRGMGCTAEVVMIDGHQVIIGHVGDSRVYHFRQGKLRLVTRDQTFVQRMVDLGQLSEKEAEIHPRRAELEQAVGGRSDIFPDVFTLTLIPGDWLLVCSDGLSNQLHTTVIEQVLFSHSNADKAARCLINLALEDGAFDNVTVALVRAH